MLVHKVLGTVEENAILDGNGTLGNRRFVEMLGDAARTEESINNCGR